MYAFINYSIEQFTYVSTAQKQTLLAKLGMKSHGIVSPLMVRYNLSYLSYLLLLLSTGSQPNCITAVMNWVHGTYALQSNGSIVLTPNGDGYQQIQDPCAAVSDFIENYNDTELIPNFWYAYTDSTLGQAIQLYAFDGTPLAPQYVVSATPNMLPTQQLRNVTAATTVLARRGNGAVRMIMGDWTLASTAATVVLAVAASML